MFAVGFLAVVLLVIAEIVVFVQVAQWIGAGAALLLLVAETLIGAWIVKHEGRRAWRGLRSGLESGRAPSRELIDGFLILCGGILVLVPGFVSDVAGFLLILPFTRPLFRRIVMLGVARRVQTTITRAAGGRVPGGGAGGPRHWGSGHWGPVGGAGDRVVRGEIVDDDDPR